MMQALLPALAIAFSLYCNSYFFDAKLQLMKTVLSLFARESTRFYVFIVLTGLLNSVLNSAFVIVIGKTIANSNFSIINGQEAFVFIGLLLSCFVINYIFNSYLIRTSARMMFEVELSIIRKIKETSFR